MKQVLDFHIHSRYARACSKDLNPQTIAQGCLRKGIDIVGTGDFTHPQWLKLLQAELVEVDQSGLFVLKNNTYPEIKFILTAEVSLVYKDETRTRRIHLVIHAPSFDAVEKLNQALIDRGFNLRSDGRPIMKFPAPDFVKLCLNINPDFLIYPAHIWTPWYSVFGSKSGFNSLEECFGNQTKHIFAIETGLSSDPAMNWRLSKLDNITILSNSDAHSVQNIGREANVFAMDEISYQEINRIIKTKDQLKFKYTIEFYPEEGMYHIDGHRGCNFSCLPSASKKLKGICPKCHKALTLGVLYRVNELADRPVGYLPKDIVPFKKLIGLEKIIAETIGLKSRNSKKVQQIYQALIRVGNNELTVLLDLDENSIAQTAGKEIAQGIINARLGQVTAIAGFDGLYGHISIAN